MYNISNDLLYKATSLTQWEQALYPHQQQVLSGLQVIYSLSGKRCTDSLNISTKQNTHTQLRYGWHMDTKRRV